MTRNFRIVIADRSVLAENLYRLLFAGIDADITLKKRFEEARPRYFRREGVDLGIVNTNCLGKRADEILTDMAASPELARTKKILLVREASPLISSPLLKTVPNLNSVLCPFHPSEFLSIALKLLKEAS